MTADPITATLPGTRTDVLRLLVRNKIVDAHDALFAMLHELDVVRVLA